MKPSPFPVTPDGRYFVVRGRQWRMANPALDRATRTALQRDLIRARSALGRARKTDDREAHRQAREAINHAKIALGERGPVWWTDGEPDDNLTMPINTPYRTWYAGLGEQTPDV
jgi:hypothetical protein